MLGQRVLVDSLGLQVAEVRCTGRGAGWSAAEPIGGFAIVLPRRGVFLRRVAGVATRVDSSTGYVQRPGTTQQIAHPAGGDLCTSIALPGLSQAPDQPVHVTPRLGLAHRLLLARAAAGADRVELLDLATEIVEAVLCGVEVANVSSLTDGVREILATEPNCPLPELARRLAVSPWHLSRAFHQATGSTLRSYRLRLRITAALEMLAAGHDKLADVAVAAGFADQAHLSRAMKSELGQPPARLRAMLSTSARRVVEGPSVASSGA